MISSGLILLIFGSSLKFTKCCSDILPRDIPLTKDKTNISNAHVELVLELIYFSCAEIKWGFKYLINLPLISAPWSK